MAKSDSPIISITIGMASSTTARLRFPEVKSIGVPRSASRTASQSAATRCFDPGASAVITTPQRRGPGGSAVYNRVQLEPGDFRETGSKGFDGVYHPANPAVHPPGTRHDAFRFRESPFLLPARRDGPPPRGLRDSPMRCMVQMLLATLVPGEHLPRTGVLSSVSAASFREASRRYEDSSRPDTPFAHLA